MIEFATYYKQYFKNDLIRFLSQIPILGNKHYDKNEFNIQYFFLVPYYNYLDTVPVERQANFIVSLFWSVLVDQVFYSHFKSGYQKFRLMTLYPKFIGNCTAPSMMSSECGHHQHPKRILEAANDFMDTGNSHGFEREVFGSNESVLKRGKIDLSVALAESVKSMECELENYFQDHHPEICWTEFWDKCKAELSVGPTLSPW